jgi:DNA modification methylase
MKIENVKIKKLKPAEYNPRKMTAKQEEDLTNSIENFGLVDPIIANKRKGRENIVIGGHQRLKIAKKLGYKDIPVVYVDLELKREKELNLRLNKNTGEWDWELLKNFDESFLLNAGFDNFEIDKIFQEKAEEDDFDVEKEAEKIKKPKVKKGEIYQLGNHRLMCGDSTSEEDVGKLMGGELANMIFTDPPYNVNYSYHSNKYHGQVIFNDNLSNDEFYKFLLKAFINIEKFSNKQMSWYIFCGYTTEPIFRKAIDEAGLYFQQQIIWLKEHFVLARGQAYHRAYEPVLYGKKRKGTGYKNKEMTKETDMLDLDFDNFQDRLDVWYLHRDKTNEYKHPTQKPVRVSERAIKMSSKRNDIVLDLFGGGGASLIACEQLKRQCMIMELDPIYAEVILKRYEKYTAKKAKKIK